MTLNPDIGVGLRIPHHNYFLAHPGEVAWMEVHSENYFEDARLRADLLQIRESTHLSLHGTGLSLGSVDPLDPRHMRRLRHLVKDAHPDRISEHLSWSSFNGQYFNDLLPLPYTEEALAHFAERVDQVQQFLGRQILIENPSTYLEAEVSQLTEWDFLASLPTLTGCGLLLDLNNLYVGSLNHGYDCETYLQAIDPQTVGEIHLAGFHVRELENDRVFIDTHGAPVAAPVWDLYQTFLDRHGARPTLIEWDTNLPSPQRLLAEADKAKDCLRTAIAGVAS